MASYLDALTEAMTRLGRRDDAVFLGQAVAYPGTAMTRTFAGVPREKLIELPVFENTQLGLATGLSLAGALPICVFPRINFLLCAMDQLLLHLDALPRYSAYRPKVIIRTASPTAIPLDAGAQHLDPDDDYLCGLERMLKTVVVDVIERGADVLSAYEAAAERAESTLLVERTALYETEA